MDLAGLSRGDDAVIIGTSGFAVELAGLLKDVGVKVRGCIGPSSPPPGAGPGHLGGDENLSEWTHVPMVVGIGEPKLRRALFERIIAAGGHIATFIHPLSYVSSAASVAEGVIVYPNATVHAAVSL